MDNFYQIRQKYLNIQGNIKNKKKAINYTNTLLDTKYIYHFDWFGFPIIQFPSDIVVLQEIIFKVKPDIIIECGIGRGGSLIFYSSLLSLIKKDLKLLV